MAKSLPNNNLLEKEYFHIQSVIEDFDSKSLTIKAWSVSLVGLISGASAFTENKMVILFAALVSLMFWCIDGAWKTFQFANYRRSREIEKYMKGEIDQIDNLQIGTSWSASYRDGGLKRLLKIMFWLHVILPHGAMFILLTSVYFIFYL